MSRPVARLKDPPMCDQDSVPGPASKASGDVKVNDRGALRMEDVGEYSCDAANDWHLIEGAATVFVNDKELGGKGDGTAHPHGTAPVSLGSGDVFVGGPTANLLEQVRADSIAMIDKVLRALDRWNEQDKALFRKYFGDDSEAAREEVRRKYERMRKVLQTIEIVQMDDGAYGEIRDKKSDKMYLGRKFWKAPRMGRDSKAGTYVHEASHPTDGAGTDDFGGKAGQPGAKRVYGKDAEILAQKDPAGARQNAENYEYFAEDQP